MFKDILKQQQPVVYQTLYNGLNKKQLSHCYLFVGPKGSLKREAAFLLAQSLVCEDKDSDVFGCEQCASCIRINENNYIDLVYIDGTNQTIKAEAIANLQTQFEKTALEKVGKKIFIINGCENLTTKSANSLLKFIEEPRGELTGIFITTQLDRVLPTIVSRCQMLNFKSLSKDHFLNLAKEKNIDELNAHFIAQLSNEVSDVEQLYTNKNYNNAVSTFCEFFIRMFEEKDKSYIYLQDTFAKINKNDQKSTRPTFTYFLDIFLIFISDYLNNMDIDDETYQKMCGLAKHHDFEYAKYLKTLIETKDALNNSANALLLIDQMLYKFKEEQQ